MSHGNTEINKELFDQFAPLKIIPEHLRDDLLKHAMIATFDVYANIVKHSNKRVLHHFLVDGYADIRHSFDKRVNISASDSKCAEPLETLIEGGGVVRAITPCKVLIINCNYLDEVLEKISTSKNDVVSMKIDDSIIDDSHIDDDYKSDWMTLFYQSQLAMNLSPTQTQQVFSSLENIEVKSGETIISCHSEGDYFYILKEGYAEIESDQAGIFKGKKFDVEPGDYFGDEALVAGTIRNASIIMTTEGVLGRMSLDAFNKIIKSALVITPTKEELLGIKNPIYCDVRLPFEYRKSHCPHSINVPVGKIRKNIDSFDKNLTYIITPEGEERSELATYLMRQSGIEAYYMDWDLLDSISEQKEKAIGF